MAKWKLRDLNGVEEWAAFALVMLGPDPWDVQKGSPVPLTVDK